MLGLRGEGKPVTAGAADALALGPMGSSGHGQAGAGKEHHLPLGQGMSRCPQPPPHARSLPRGSAPSTLLFLGNGPGSGSTALTFFGMD